MRFFGILIAAAALTFGLGACGGAQPVYNVNDAAVVGPVGKNVSMDDVSKAIMRAGTGLGWQMQQEGLGRISGRIALRTHLATIDVAYDTKSYSIKYRESTGLDARDGMIHKNYNGWIQNLEKAIQSQLRLL